MFVQMAGFFYVLCVYRVFLFVCLGDSVFFWRYFFCQVGFFFFLRFSVGFFVIVSLVGRVRLRVIVYFQVGVFIFLDLLAFVFVYFLIFFIDLWVFFFLFFGGVVIFCGDGVIDFVVCLVFLFRVFCSVLFCQSFIFGVFVV